jgi:hypothetical protein
MLQQVLQERQLVGELEQVLSPLVFQQQEEQVLELRVLKERVHSHP